MGPQQARAFPEALAEGSAVATELLPSRAECCRDRREAAKGVLPRPAQGFPGHRDLTGEHPLELEDESEEIFSAPVRTHQKAEIRAAPGQLQLREGHVDLIIEEQCKEEALEHQLISAPGPGPGQESSRWRRWEVRSM